MVKWSIIEPAIALTAASFATLRPLFSSRPKRALSVCSDDLAPSGKPSQETLVECEDEYPRQFAAMLGLSERYGVRTYVYADKKIVAKEDLERERLEAAWTAEDLEDSIEVSNLNPVKQTGESSRSVGESICTADNGWGRIDWASGYRTTVITQTSE